MDRVYSYKPSSSMTEVYSKPSFSMDEVYYRPYFSQLSREWNEFKKDKYKILFPNYPYTDDSPKPELYKCRDLYHGFLRNAPLGLLMSELDNDLYQLILWEESLVSLIDSIGHQGLLGLRRLEEIESYHESLIEIITACDEVTAFISTIGMFRDEIDSRRSRRDVFKKNAFR